MREILFRGKRTDNGEWVEGYYCNLGGNHPRILKENIFIGKIGRVLEFKNIDVLPETVGLYTGLTDKNGTKIFEGDILGGFLDEEYPEHETVAVVEWRECMWVTHQRNCYPDLLEESDMDWFEVIGNIHDNPELLETAAKPADKNIAQNGLAPATENFELMEG